VVLGGLVLRVGVAHHRDLLRPATPLASRLPRWPRRSARLGPRFRRLGRVPAEGALALSLILGLAGVALAAAGVGKLVDDVTDGDGVAVLDHPVAGFVAAHRAPPLTSVMEPVSTAGGPAPPARLRPSADATAQHTEIHRHRRTHDHQTGACTLT
jgi:hypothetical protein